MDKRPLTLLLIFFGFSILLSGEAHAWWTEYTQVSYVDMDGDLVSEIIIKAKYGAGSNHYVEDIRIFKDYYPKLDLIFSAKTLDSSFGFENPSEYNYDIVSTVEITEQTPENNGIRDIIVKSKKIYYKDWENKIIDKEEDLGTRVYKWDGKKYIESK